MDLYTRRGDDGSTDFFGGERTGKDHPRVEAFGTVDELNAQVGLAVTACDGARPLHGRLVEMLGDIMSRLFDLGADLATPVDTRHRDKVAAVTDAHVTEVERWIDEIDGPNRPMKNFVLPGGTALAARLHVARTVCRRAERRIVALTRMSEINPESVRYVNRLSDLFFAMARRVNADADVPDVPWIPDKKS
jgi:cob(I)alamin adenosyltransferase